LDATTVPIISSPTIAPIEPQHRSGDRITLALVPRTGTAPGGASGQRPRSARPQGQRARAANVAGDEGFTLVELLVVVLVLVALIAIAVPTFTGQREGAWDAAVRSELRSASIALESYRAQNGVYSSDALLPGSAWGFETSGNLEYKNGFTLITPTTYCLVAQHVSARTPNLNTTWMARENERIRTIMIGETCADIARD
jgi:prepilin-type N-terminal cleavage/methylation domain-containing protein